MAIECSQVAYEKLQDAGIEKRLNDREEDIENILLSRTIWEGRSRKLVDEAIGDASRTGMSDEFYKDVAALSKELEDDGLCLHMSSKNLPDHPFLLGGVVFGSDIGSFQKYGFESEKDFVEAITAYSIGERDSYGGCDHVWRSNGRKNEINLIGNLGDSCVLQIDVSGAGPVLRDPLSYGFGWKQDSSQFLAIALKYVEALGMRDCDEIKNWEKIVAELRHPCGNGYYSWIEGGKEISSEVKSLMDHYCLPVAGSVPEMSPSRIVMGGSAVWAQVSDNKELEFLVKSDDGNIDFNYMKLKLKKSVTYAPEDVPDLLMGVYKTFARSRVQMCEILDYFCDNK